MKIQAVGALQLYKSGNEGFCSIPYFCLGNSDPVLLLYHKALWFHAIIYLKSVLYD